MKSSTRLTAVLVLMAVVLMALPLRATTPALPSAHHFAFDAIDPSEKHPLKQWAGKVVLVVNTASFCGFTPQYEGLQALWKKYRGRGLVVLGVPSNDFGGQEPKAEKEIKEFCQGAYMVTFPLTAKYHVVGDNAHPFYRWAADMSAGDAVPQWNFHKLLIGPDGALAGSFDSAVKPQSGQLIKAIEAQLTKVTH